MKKNYKIGEPLSDDQTKNDMKNKEEIEINTLEDISGGTETETKEILYYIHKYYPDVKTSGRGQPLRKFLKTLGISDYRTYMEGHNEYYDEDGNPLTHEEVVQILKDNKVK